MPPNLKHILLTISLLSCSNTFATLLTPETIRSTGIDSAKSLIGWQCLINRYDVGPRYDSFSITMEIPIPSPIFWTRVPSIHEIQPMKIRKSLLILALAKIPRLGATSGASLLAQDEKHEIERIICQHLLSQGTDSIR